MENMAIHACGVGDIPYGFFSRENQVINFLPIASMFLSGGRYSANEAFRELLEIGAKDNLIADIEQRVLDADMDKVRSFFLNAERNEEIALRIIFSEKRIKWIRFSKTILMFAALPLAVFCARDITEQMMMEEELVMSQKLEAVGMHASGIIHDFNNILMVIESGMELLGEAPMDSGLEKVFQMIKDAVQKGKNLSKNLLNLNLNIHPEGNRGQDFRLFDLFEKSSWPDNWPPIQVDMQIPDRSIVGDLEAFKRLLENLIKNALEETAYQGMVMIEVKKVGARLMICVIDNGKGVPDELKEDIFKPFFSTKNKGNKEGSRNFGIGLAACQSIAKNHGGFIRVEDNRYGGATFSIILPA